MKRKQGKRLGPAAAAVAVLLAAVPLAAAAELSRDEYVARAEPICKTNVLANKRIFKGAKGEVKAGKLKQASTHFSRAATAFAKTIGQLEAVPQPAADEARLAKWLGYLRTEKNLIQKVGRALAANDKHKAESYSVDLNHNSNLANNTVLGFGFDYCRIDPSRFG
jgi:hypothetical protein